MQTKLALNGLLLSVLLAACSHVRYVPEIPDSNGVIFDHDALVYSIPPVHPVDKMKLSFRGIKDGNKLYLHMRFIRKGKFDPAKEEILDPKDQTIQIEGDGPFLSPVKVHASIHSRPVIKLTNASRQAVDLVYELPVDKGEPSRIEFFNFRWKIQNVAGESGFHTVRFDRRHSSLTSFTEDSDFSIYSDYDDSGWYPNDWGWW